MEIQKAGVVESRIFKVSRDERGGEGVWVWKMRRKQARVTWLAGWPPIEYVAIWRADAEPPRLQPLISSTAAL